MIRRLVLIVLLIALIVVLSGVYVGLSGQRIGVGEPLGPPSPFELPNYAKPLTVDEAVRFTEDKGFKLLLPKYLPSGFRIGRIWLFGGSIIGIFISDEEITVNTTKIDPYTKGCPKMAIYMLMMFPRSEWDMIINSTSYSKTVVNNLTVWLIKDKDLTFRAIEAKNRYNTVEFYYEGSLYYIDAYLPIGEMVKIAKSMIPE